MKTIDIDIVNTFSLKKELSGTNSAPVEFLIDDYNSTYFVKYILSESTKEFDFLIYELVCNKLAIHFDIPSPKVSFVNIKEGSFGPQDLIVNKNHLVSGILAFGSKNIGYNNIVAKSPGTGGVVENKNEFNRLINPLDLIKISLFDILIDNIDRSEDNYNLLLKTVGSSNKYFAIDHAAAFGGKLGKLKPIEVDYIQPNIIKSMLFKSVSVFFK